MASRSLGTLTLDLIAKIGGFTSGMDKASRHADKRMREIERRATAFGGAIGRSMRSVGAQFLAIAGVGVGIDALVGSLKNAIDRADGLRDASIRLGVGTEALSAWGYAAQQTGTDLEELNKGLLRLSRNAAEALNPDSRQARFFDALGISKESLTDLNKLVPEVADAFSRIENGATKAAVAQELFGRSGANLIEFLNQGSDGLQTMADKAAELGIIIDQDTAEAADAFNDTLGDLKNATLGLATQVAGALLPQLQELLEWTVDFVKDGDNAREVADGIASAMRDLASVGSAFGSLLGALDTLREKLVSIQKVMIEASPLTHARRGVQRMLGLGENWQSIPDFGNVQGGSAGTNQGIPDFSNVRGGAETTESGSAALQALLAAFEDRKDKTGGGSKKSGKSDAEKEAEALTRAYESQNERLKEQLALHGLTGEAVHLRYELEHGELAKLDPLKKAELLQMAEKLDRMREEKEVQDELNEVNERRAESVQQLLDDLAFERDTIGETAERQEVLNNLRWAGVDANSAYGQSIIESTEALQAQRDLVEDQVNAMDGLRDSAKGFLDDLRAGEGVWDSLKSAADRFADVLWEIVTNNLIEQALGKQGTTGAGSSGGGWFSSLLGAFFGGGSGGSSAGTVADLFSGSWGFANGGWPPANSINRVNERGFEMASVSGNDYLLTGNRPVKVTPHSQLTGGRGVTNNNHFHYAAPPDPRTQTQTAARIAFETQRAQSRNF